MNPEGTAVATTTYEAELLLNNAANMFKALGGIIFGADLTTAIPSAFTQNTTADLIQLDTTLWHRYGLVTQKDGVNFGRSTKTSDDTSWGYVESTRSDIIEDAVSAQFTMQEVNRWSQEVYDMVDLSAVHPDATTGEVAWNKPALAVPVYKRLIYMAVDGTGTSRRYRFKIMPKGQIVAVKDESWSNASATDFPVTIQAKTDPTLGYAVRTVMAGPGQKTLNTGAYFI
jgi:hypothetical protein